MAGISRRSPQGADVVTHVDAVGLYEWDVATTTWIARTQGGGAASTGNVSTAALSAGETYTGTWERNSYGLRLVKN